MEFLNRGVVAINAGGKVYVSWRLLATDPDDIAFDVYRRVGNQQPVKLNNEPITQTTDFVDTTANRVPPHTRYFAVPLINGEKSEPEWAEAPVKASPYLAIKLDRPGGGYSANDCSVGDLDGDGEYEIILKWEGEAHDNAHGGKTDNVLLDAYKLDGTKLWRIDLGENIRAGAHYTQFMVYDFDGNGRAELICKTADGTKDGQGNYIGERHDDWVNGDGRILSGPEYLTCFDGVTGAAICTTNYVPYRVPGNPSELEPSDGELKRLWGDGYGNRSERYLACVAYLDGVHPSVVMCRGYYTRTFLVAWDFDGGKFVQRWVFDSDQVEGEYAGQGNHSLAVGDVDGDGKDEILYGAMCVDDDGTGLYTTAMGHGDAHHFTDLDPDRPGLEMWTCQEHPPYGNALRDAGTGEIIFRREAGKDTGRACAADIDPTHPGCELWGSTGCPLYDAKGNVITTKYRLPMNFVVNWDGDDLVELLSGTTISKYNWKTGELDVLLEASNYDCESNNGTKATPCLSGDIFGDYREEVIWRTDDSKELRIFSTTIPAKRRLITLMQDPIYRLSIAWQNVAYNQPPHPSFFMGDGMKTPSKPNIEIIKPR